MYSRVIIQDYCLLAHSRGGGLPSSSVQGDLPYSKSKGFMVLSDSSEMRELSHVGRWRAVSRQRNLAEPC